MALKKNLNKHKKKRSTRRLKGSSTRRLKGSSTRRLKGSSTRRLKGSSTRRTKKLTGGNQLHAAEKTWVCRGNIGCAKNSNIYI